MTAFNRYFRDRIYFLLNLRFCMNLEFHSNLELRWEWLPYEKVEVFFYGGPLEI